MPIGDEKIAFYDRRKPLAKPVGLPRDFFETEIKLPQYRELLTHVDTRDLIKSDDMPLPAPIDREGHFGERHLEYWLSGYFDALKLRGLTYQPTEPSKRIKCLDFGGCSGRVMRHVARMPSYEAWLCDINASYIDWIDEHSTRNIYAFQNRPGLN